MQLWDSRRIRKEKQELKRKAVLGIMLTLLFMGIFSLAFDIQPVKAFTISSDYTFTSDIYESIVVTADNIIIDGAGYTVQGTGSGRGIDLIYRNNVTLKNVEVTNFNTGILLYYSSNNTLSGNNASSNNVHGINLESSSNNTITGNTASSNNNVGIYSVTSSNNTITGNTASNNDYGIYLSSSSNNVLFHNNLINNTFQAIVTTGYVNTWDDGYPSGGNYWSGYPDVDLEHDGIGDTEHVIDANNTDNYPLMGMFSDFKATSEHHVQTICNSSISDFQFNGTAISFNVTGENDTTGFCRICIPTALMNETYRVFVNGTEILPSPEPLPYSNSTHSYLYFTYNLSTQEVIIIPEFPSFLILPLLMIATLLAAMTFKRKHRANLRVPI